MEPRRNHHSREGKYPTAGLGTPMKPIDLASVIRLLIGERPERFPYERAIRLFQLRVWFLFPNEGLVEMAGLTAATRILEHISDDVFAADTEAEQRKQRPWDSV